MFNLFDRLLQPTAPSTDLEPHDALASLSSYHLVDVRQPGEYEGPLGHIQGAELIPLASLPAAVQRLRKLDKPLLMICRSGARSAAGAALLTRAGIGRVFNLHGGMLRWNAEQLPQCDGARRDGARRDGARRDGARRDGAGRDGAGRNGAGRNGANHDDGRRGSGWGLATAGVASCC